MNKVVKVNARKVFLATDINENLWTMIAAERGIIARAFMKDKATMRPHLYAEPKRKNEIHTSSLRSLI